MMTRYIRTFFLPVLIMLAALFAGTSAVAGNIVVENKAIRLEFDAATGAILSFYDLKSSQEFLDSKSARSASLWELETAGPAGPEKLNMMAAGAFHFSRPATHTLVLEWSNFKGARNAALRVTATVRLEDGRSLSAWNISLSGLAGEQPNRIIFPSISGLKDMQNEELAVPVWMGELIKNPRAELAKGGKKSSWRYPGSLSLQLLALYNTNTRGFYAACNDARGYAKYFSFLTDSIDNLSGYRFILQAALRCRHRRVQGRLDNGRRNIQGVGNKAGLVPRQPVQEQGRFFLGRQDGVVGVEPRQIR
jgi:hypothetical protein